MKAFIPNIDDPPESDDSSDEIPPGGVFPGNGVVIIDEGEGPDDNDNNAGSDAEVSGISDNDDNGDDDDDMSGDDVSISGDDDLSSDSDTSSNDSATMGDIFGVEPSLEATRDHPPDLEADSGIVDVCFHPTHEIIAAATMDGEVIMYRYNKESVEEVSRLSHHKKACRAVSYNDEGTLLFTISKDKSLGVIDTQNSALKHHIKDAHESAIFSFCPIDDYLCATGDDDGVVKIWDFRKRKSIFEFKCGEQTITSLLCDERKRTLVASVSDGSIAGINIRGKKLELQSEMYESELTSLCLVRGGSRLVVGSGEGSLYIFNWGEFGFHIDNFPGHPDQVHCMVPITDRMILTGCEDGVIRAVHLYGHRFVGVVGQHKDFGVENMSVSCDGSILASCSMDEVVRFWNVEYLYDIEVDDRVKGDKKKDIENNLESSKRRNQGDFFKDFPAVADSDDESGPVAGPSNVGD